MTASIVVMKFVIFCKITEIVSVKIQRLITFWLLNFTKVINHVMKISTLNLYRHKASLMAQGSVHFALICKDYTILLLLKCV